jgi:hypothetical protein
MQDTYHVLRRKFLADRMCVLMSDGEPELFREQDAILTGKQSREKRSLSLNFLLPMLVYLAEEHNFEILDIESSNEHCCSLFVHATNKVQTGRDGPGYNKSPFQAGVPNSVFRSLTRSPGGVHFVTTSVPCSHRQNKLLSSHIKCRFLLCCKTVTTRYSV